MTQTNENTLRTILNKLNSLEKQINDLRREVKTDINDLRRKVKTDIDDLKHHLDSEIIKVKASNGKQITTVNLKIRELNSKIGGFEKMLKIKPHASQSSVIVELGINNAVRDYYQDMYITAKMHNIKQDVINIFNEATGQNNEQLLIFNPDTINFSQASKSNLLTEFDGLFRLTVGSRKELIIIESKMIFTLKHLKDKFKIFKKFRELVDDPVYAFKNRDYYRAFTDCFRGYDQITVVYGALHWEIDLDKLYLDDDQVVYDPEHLLYPEDQDDTLKMICDQQTKFVVNTVAGFKVYNEAECFSGGSTETDD